MGVSIELESFEWHSPLALLFPLNVRTYSSDIFSANLVFLEVIDHKYIWYAHFNALKMLTCSVIPAFSVIFKMYYDQDHID